MFARRRRPNRLTYSRPQTGSRVRLPHSIALPRGVQRALDDQQRDSERAAIRAAGTRVSNRETENLRRLIQPWQRRAYGYYDTVPEIKYGAQFYSRMLSPLRLFAARIDENGEVVEIEDPTSPEEKLAVAHVERIQDPGGGRSNLLGTYGRLAFLAGESYLTVQKNADGVEEWEMLSPEELRLSPGGDFYRLRAPQLAPEQVRNAPDDAFESLEDGEAVVYRLWRRHPVYSALADSTMQAVLEVCEELLLLSRGVRNRTRSRIASAGLLLVNGEVTSVSMSGGEAEENPDEDIFLRDLTEAAVTAIADESSASSVVPMIVRVDAGSDVGGLDNVMKHIQFVDPNQLVPEMGQRREAIERLAVGLDMPPEVLLGIGGVNHWSGWMVDEQSWKLHGQPIAQGLVDDLTAAYYRPTLAAEGINEVGSFCIGYDAAAVISQPDKAKDAKDLHDRGAIGAAALRESANFGDDDAPSAEEHQEWLGIKLGDANVAINGEPAQAALPPALGGDPEEGDEEDDTVDGGDTAGEAKKAPPDPEEAEQVSASVVYRIIGASEVTLQRTLEMAGSRLRSFAKRDKAAEALIDGVPNPKVAFTLGPDRVRELDAPAARSLVAGAKPLLEQALAAWRLDVSIAEPLADRIEQHAARVLFAEKPPTLPAQFENYVRGLEAVLVR